MPPQVPLMPSLGLSKSNDSDPLSPGTELGEMADELFFNDNLALKDDMEAAGADYDRLETEMVREDDNTPDSCAREAMFLGYAK